MLMVVWSPCYQGGINHAHLPWGQQPYIAISGAYVWVYVAQE